MVPRGPKLITFRGRQIERSQGFIYLADITCPDGHPIRTGSMTIRGDVGLLCTHRPSSGQGECGAYLWLVQLPAPEQRKLWYYADVEWREVRAWLDADYTLEDILRYLGAWSLRGDTRPRRRDRGA